MTQCCDVILINSKSEILLLLRTPHDKLFPNKWCLPGGHAEEGESLKLAATRETYEESGILCRHIHDITPYTFPDGFETEFFYAIEGQDFEMTDIKLSPAEHTESRWVKPADVFTKYDLAGNLKAGLTEVTKSINKNK